MCGGVGGAQHLGYVWADSAEDDRGAEFRCQTANLGQGGAAADDQGMHAEAGWQRRHSPDQRLHLLARLDRSVEADDERVFRDPEFSAHRRSQVGERSIAARILPVVDDLNSHLFQPGCLREHAFAHRV